MIYDYTIGLDLSPDHGGIVVLDVAGKVIDAGFLTTVKKYASIDDRAIILSKIGKGETKEYFRMRRFDEYMGALYDNIPIFMDQILYENTTAHCCLEGYAFNAKSTGILQIAELTGYIKHVLWRNHVPLRIHDPLSVKMFATNNGFALKSDVVNYARENGIDIPEKILKKVKKKRRGEIIIDDDGPGTDLADAYTLAKMLHVENLVSTGVIRLQSLDPGARKLFLRVTTANPVNLLARPMELPYD